MRDVMFKAGVPPLALLSALMCLVPACAAAAEPPGTSATSASAATLKPRVSHAQLHHFMAAYQAVSRIRKQLMIETHGLQDRKKVGALKKRAEKNMKAAILEHLTLGEYVRIGKAVNTDAKLHARFMAMRSTFDPPPVPATR